MAEAAPVAPLHSWPVRVYYEDTDAGGIVYHVNYLRFAERARTEMLRTLGFDHPRLLGEHGVRFAVRRCAIDYLRPAALDDALTVATAVRRIGGASLTLDQAIARGDDLLARLEIGLALLAPDGRPARVPRLLRERLTSSSVRVGAATP